MKNGASDMLFRYEGHGKSFRELLGIYLGQIEEELTPLPNHDITDEYYEEIEKMNHDLTQQARAMREAAEIALALYERYPTDEEAARVMQAYEGNETVVAIGYALEYRDWARLAI